MKLVVVDDLRRGMVTGEDVFPPGNRSVPYVREDTVLTDLMISEMRRLKIRSVFIKGRRSSQASVTVAPVIAKPRPSIQPVVKEAAVSTLETLFTQVQIDTQNVHSAAQIVKQLDQVVDQLVDSLVVNSGVIINMNDLKSYDEYTYHHSLSVAVLSIAMAHYMGFNRAQLQHIGMCGIMHDIGKTAIPLEVLNKPSKLEDHEFAMMKNHSSAGYEYLVKAQIGDEEMKRGVLHHHEKYDGTGYPDRLKGEDIPLISRIISVGDVYDALTSNRPYREPMQPAEAIEFIMGGVGSAFDYDVVTAFIEKVELYPVGSRIQLSNGRTATVLSNENQMRPVVRTQAGEILDLYRDRKCLSLVITRILTG